MERYTLIKPDLQNELKTTQRYKGRAETGEMRAFLDMAREANIRK